MRVNSNRVRVQKMDLSDWVVKEIVVSLRNRAMWHEQNKHMKIAETLRALATRYEKRLA